MVLSTGDPAYREAEARIKKAIDDQVRPLQRKIGDLERKVATLERQIADLLRRPIP